MNQAFALVAFFQAALSFVLFFGVDQGWGFFTLALLVLPALALAQRLPQTLLQLTEVRSRLEKSQEQEAKFEELLEVMLRAGQGDLSPGPQFSSHRAAQEDLAGRMSLALDQLLQRFSHLLERLRALGVDLANSTYAIASQDRVQEASADEHVDSIRQVLRSSEAVDSEARELVACLRGVSQTCERAAHGAEDCQQRFSRLKQLKEEMLGASGSVLERLNALGSKAESINQVVTSFAVVAHDTNLLYINAAIAAEKAGEFGQGFQAVAQEIRRMAERNSLSAVEIEQSVADLQQAVRLGSQQMKDFLARIERDAIALVEVSSHFVQLGSQVQLLSPQFEEAVAGVEAQSRSAHQMVHQIKLVAGKVQQSVAAVKSSHLALTRVHQVASELKIVTAGFNLDSPLEERPDS